MPQEHGLITQVVADLEQAIVSLEAIQEHLNTLTPKERNAFGQELSKYKEAFIKVHGFRYIFPNIHPWDLDELWTEEDF